MKKTPTPTSVQALINSRADIWRGSHAGRQHTLQVQSSFYPALDALLPKNGWPLHQLCELYFPTQGIGELQLLLPALQHLHQQSPHLHLCMINPPLQPYLHTLSLHSIVQIETEHDLWSTEECLTSGACYATLLWLTSTPTYSQLRRLQLAAQKGNTWCIILQMSKSIPNRSPAPLRLSLAPCPSQQPWQQSLTITILKKPLGWAGQQCQIIIEAQTTPAPHLQQGSLLSQQPKIQPLYTARSPLSQATIPPQMSSSIPPTPSKS